MKRASFVFAAALVAACQSSSPDDTLGGDVGAGGTAGASNVGGAAGQLGTAGANTTAGQTGTAGHSGTAGQTAAGNGGNSTVGGQSGVAGAAGSAGQNGVAGASGVAGQTAAGSAGQTGDAGAAGAPSEGGGAGATAGSSGGAPDCGTPTQCAAIWEQNATAKYTSLLTGSQDDLMAFLTAVPKGGDLHNHLTGAVYAETYLTWAAQDGDCINSSDSVVYKSSCSTSTQPTPASGTFYDQIIDAWSMRDFMTGAQNGHDHFFATFAKYGAVAGAHRNDDLGDVLARAASENELYVETMFNLGQNVGDVSAADSTGTLTADELPALYAKIIADAKFVTALAKDVADVTSANDGYAKALGCTGSNPPAACGVGVRFVAQISRTGAPDTIFGQLVSSFEMAEQTNAIVAADLSSPEDNTTSLKNYELHMAMLDFLYNQYTVTKKSPLHVTLHAGELTPEFLPTAYATANTFHVRDAVEKGHAQRIGHGVDILSETDPTGLMQEMSSTGVMVEVCLSSNAQILNISGADHPLHNYLQNNVPVALATDDQGVSRSSMAGEYLRGALDQQLTYLDLKTVARTSLEHAFIEGASLWATFGSQIPVDSCVATDTVGIGDPATAACQTFLDGSPKAKLQWELEHRFRLFESAQ